MEDNLDVKRSYFALQYMSKVMARLNRAVRALIDGSFLKNGRPIKVKRLNFVTSL